MHVTADQVRLTSPDSFLVRYLTSKGTFDVMFHRDWAPIGNDRVYYLTRAKYYDGTRFFRVVDKFVAELEVQLADRKVFIASGTSGALLLSLSAMANPGDEVIIPAPYWVSYPDIVLLGGGTPVFVEAGIETGFKLTPEALEAAITPKTRLVLLNNPVNPIGRVFSAQEFQMQAVRQRWVFTLRQNRHGQIGFKRDKLTFREINNLVGGNVEMGHGEKGPA